MTRPAPFALALIALGCAFVLGCARKAPGPDECAEFARAIVQQSSPSPWLTPQLEAQIEDETRLCLTRPYDRELLNCVLTTRRARLCLASFKRRTGEIE